LERPEWLQMDLVEKGARAYVAGGMPVAFALTSASLVHSYGASYGSQVLTETGRYVPAALSPSSTTITTATMTTVPR